MDISAGLVALGHAVGIAKDLRDIERGVDEASFKLKLAELIEALAESMIALSLKRSKVYEIGTNA